MESITIELDVDDAGLILEILHLVVDSYQGDNTLHFQALTNLNTAIQESLNNLTFEPEPTFEHF